MSDYAKIIVKGSPITKSNFKLHNTNGRAILPDNSGKYHDRYALYEQEISLIARSQNPDVVFTESLIAILKVYYKSEKRHPDTINITKSIFDGIEKSGLIVNDAQIRRIITEEFYDKENPRFELELYPESKFNIDYSICKKKEPSKPVLYSSLRKNLSDNLSKTTLSSKSTKKTALLKQSSSTEKICNICKKPIITLDFIKADSGKTLICKKCFTKLF
ncbi:MAG: RusA family crossover junction endodeoxyribonuclease [Clostridium butyricum]|nr:RusA family crossover junction endodeoxyribonuclease [Clostridium butyricum]